MSGYDIACALLGLPLLGGLAYAINGAMHDRHRIETKKRRQAVIADAIESEYARRDVRRALAAIDLPRD